MLSFAGLLGSGVHSLVYLPQVQPLRVEEGTAGGRRRAHDLAADDMEHATKSKKREPLTDGVIEGCLTLPLTYSHPLPIR